MLLDVEKTLTAKALQRSSQQKFYDRITVVTDRLPQVKEQLTALYELRDWELGGRTEKNTKLHVLQGGSLESIPFAEQFAVAYLGNVELCLVSPKGGDTACTKYFARYGEGLCCVRENVAPERWDGELARYAAMGISVVQTDKDDTGETVWMDTMALLGGLLALHLDSEESAKTRRTLRNDRRLTQVNIVTDDVKRTVADLSALLQVGPWNIGTLNNQTVTNPSILVAGKMVTPVFQFLLGITFFSNIEFEVIQPVKGPTVYREFLSKHGVGFHHIKEVVPVVQWHETLEDYAKKNISLSITGKVGPTSFAYLASEREFGFVVELGDGIPLVPIPDGYNDFWYPGTSV